MNELLEKHGAMHAHRLVPVEFCKFFTHVLLRQADISPCVDGQVPTAKVVMVHDVMFETLHEFYWDVIEELTGEELLPTYAFARLYSNGDELEKHVDRDACDISVTIQLGRSHNYAWPIYMGDMRFDMAEGDGVIYKGCDIAHWRNKCDGPEGYYSGQLFLHYVRKNGPRASEVGDSTKRDTYTYARNRTHLMENK